MYLRPDAANLAKDGDDGGTMTDWGGRDRDGTVTERRIGSVRTTEVVSWPLSRLLPDALPALSEMRELERVDLSGEHFPTQILDRRDLTSLGSGVRELALHGAYLDGDDLVEALRDSRGLTAIDMSGIDLEDRHVTALVRSHSALAKLAVGRKSPSAWGHRFSAPRLTAGVWRALSDVASLRGLALRGIPLTDETIAERPELLARLEELDLACTRIGDMTATRIADAPRLRRLSLYATGLTDAGADALARAARINDVDVSHTALGPAGVRQLVSRSDLRRLALAGIAAADDETTQGLEAATALDELDLSGTRIRAATLHRVARLPSLRRLDLFGVLTEVAERIALAGMASLQNVRLSLATDWSGIAAFEARSIEIVAAPPAKGASSLPVGVKDVTLYGALEPNLGAALSRLAFLERLVVSGGGEHLASAAPDSFPRLRTLIAEDAGIDDAALDSLGALPAIEALHVSCNPVGPAVARL